MQRRQENPARKCNYVQFSRVSSLTSSKLFCVHCTSLVGKTNMCEKNKYPCQNHVHQRCFFLRDLTKHRQHQHQSYLLSNYDHRLLHLPIREQYWWWRQGRGACCYYYCHPVLYLHLCLAGCRKYHWHQRTGFPLAVTARRARSLDCWHWPHQMEELNC